MFAVSSCLHSGVLKQRQLIVSIYRDGIQALNILDVLVILPIIYNDVISIILHIIMWNTHSVMCATILKDSCLSHIQKVMALEIKYRSWDSQCQPLSSTYVP